MRYLILYLVCLTIGNVSALQANNLKIKEPRGIVKGAPIDTRDLKSLPREAISVPNPRNIQSVSEELERIVNGTETEKNKYPFMANLILDQGNYRYHFCGGSIYDATTVITAAHCVDEQTATDIVIGFGDWNQQKQEPSDVLIRAASYVKHESYNSPSQMYNDIAIIKLSKAITFSAERKPIKLPHEDVNPGDMCMVIGWGVTEDTGSEDILRGVNVPIISTKECTQPGWYSPGMVQDKQLCAGYAEGLRDSCQGDSGGPLFRNVNGEFELVGVVSWGVGCADPKNPGVYQNVFYYKKWIESKATGNDNIGDDAAPVNDDNDNSNNDATAVDNDSSDSSDTSYSSDDCYTWDWYVSYSYWYDSYSYWYWYSSV